MLIVVKTTEDRKWKKNKRVIINEIEINERLKKESTFL